MFGLHASSCRLLVKYKIDLKSRTVRISGVGRSDDTLGTKKMDLLWRNIYVYMYIYIYIDTASAELHLPKLRDDYPTEA